MTTPKTAEKSKPQKCLRSLNDVLGKASSLCKDTKPAAGIMSPFTSYQSFQSPFLLINSAVISSDSKNASLGQGKTARRASEVTFIFNDSGHEGSENSQDDEQFRARREFLKSGLPESLRKQIAKTTATKEAYSLSCSSFQPVTHIKQTLKGRPFHHTCCFYLLQFYFSYLNIKPKTD